jgi:hypothetical protein
MAVEIARVPEGTRVRVKAASLPLEVGVEGRTGTVVAASDYHAKRLGVALDGEDRVRVFLTDELEIIEELPLPPERQVAKLRPALP